MAWGDVTPPITTWGNIGQPSTIYAHVSGPTTAFSNVGGVSTTWMNVFGEYFLLAEDGNILLNEDENPLEVESYPWSHVTGV